MTRTPDIEVRPGEQPPLAAGTWRVCSAQSRASFAARLAGRTVRGDLPLTGEVQIAEPADGSAARLTARTSAVRTGSAVLDGLLAGRGFLDAKAYPEISFRSELLVWVPTGWRAVGRLQIKDAEYELACQFAMHLSDSPTGAARRPVIASSWAIDSTWVTSQRIPALGRRIAMTCSFHLEPDI